MNLQRNMPLFTHLIFFVDVIIQKSPILQFLVYEIACVAVMREAFFG